MIIEVPDRAVPTLTALAQMPSDVRAAVIAVFSADPPWASLPALVQGVADVLKSEHASAQASALTTEVFGLASIGEVSDLSSGGVAQSVSTSAALDLNDDERASLRRGLADVLETPTVKGLGRAAALAGEHERILLAARVFTDIRPVFTDVDADPGAASLLTGYVWTTSGTVNPRSSRSRWMPMDLLRSGRRSTGRNGSLHRFIAGWPQLQARYTNSTPPRTGRTE